MANIFASLSFKTPKLQHLHKLPAFLVLALLFLQCAHPVNPGGGPKDSQPPQVLETKPANGSANFDGNKFTIEFDEFISLENILEEGLVSPPLDEQPDFKLKGKSLQVKFNETLKPNTTYSVYFGNAIVDITEKNPLSNYTYIFSTGPYVDSLSLQGEVIDAFNLEAVAGSYIMLYKDNNDTLPLESLPMEVRPYYLSKTNEEGKFIFHGLADDEYLLFSLNDLNRDYIFNQPNEAVAFLDSLIKPQYIEFYKPDTTLNDSIISVLEDSTKAYVADTLSSEDFAEDTFINYELFMFTHKDTVQKLLKAELVKRNLLRFAFSRPADYIRIESLNYDTNISWFLPEYSYYKDTINWYIKDLSVDTLQLLFFNGNDTLEQSDIRLTPKEKLKGRKRKKDSVSQKRYVEWTSNLRKRVLSPDQQPEIIFDQPISSFYTDSVWFAIAEDTILQPDFSFIDSLHRQIRIPMEWAEESKYSLFLPDSSFTDWNGLHNEEIFLEFFTKSLREYGTFVINLHPATNQPFVLQFLNDKESIVRQDFFSGDTTIVYNYLDPKKYLLKLIFDNNGNEMWDPGNYFLDKQPEKVIYYMKEINVRANWEIEEEWDF